MIPLRDANQRHRFPFVTIALIIINILIFGIEMTLGGERALSDFFDKWALIPQQLTSQFSSEAITLISSMFLHGGLMHLVGNMWFLWVFGDNIEDRLGHIPYLIFYILCGILAGLAQLVFDLDSLIPMIGASGAIAGVLGSYLILFPKVKINTLIFFVIRKKLSALVVLGFWFAMQLFNGIGSFSETAAEGGTAFFAHIGGFIAGMILIFLFPKSKLKEPIWDVS